MMTPFREGQPPKKRSQDHPFSTDDFPGWPCPFFAVLLPQHSQWHDWKSNG